MPSRSPTRLFFFFFLFFSCVTPYLRNSLWSPHPRLPPSSKKFWLLPFFLAFFALSPSFPLPLSRHQVNPSHFSPSPRRTLSQDASLRFCVSSSPFPLSPQSLIFPSFCKFLLLPQHHRGRQGDLLQRSRPTFGTLCVCGGVLFIRPSPQRIGLFFFFFRPPAQERENKGLARLSRAHDIHSFHVCASRSRQAIAPGAKKKKTTKTPANTKTTTTQISPSRRRFLKSAKPFKGLQGESFTACPSYLPFDTLARPGPHSVIFFTEDHRS